jgi:hypothetical protein
LFGEGGQYGFRVGNRLAGLGVLRARLVFGRWLWLLVRCETEFVVQVENRGGIEPFTLLRKGDLIGRRVDRVARSLARVGGILSNGRGLRAFGFRGVGCIGCVGEARPIGGHHCRRTQVGGRAARHVAFHDEHEVDVRKADAIASFERDAFVGRESSVGVLRSIRAAQIQEPVSALAHFDDGVLARDRVVGEHDIVLGIATNRGSSDGQKRDR